MSRRRTSVIWSVSRNEFQSIVSASESYSDVLRHFGMTSKGGNIKTVKRRIEVENIDDSNIPKGQGSNKGRKFGPKVPNSELFVENSSRHRGCIKKRILSDNLIPYCCADCGLQDSWNGKEIVLHLEHKNGVSNDHRLENLCFLCPNCHSQTSTYAGKSLRKTYHCSRCDAKIVKTSKMCNTCRGISDRRVERPSKEELQKLIQENSFCAIGRMFGVSDNAIRKWARNYNLETKKVKS